MITPEQLASSGSEAGQQAALFCWCQINLKNYPDLRWLFAIPNGGSRDIREAAKLKATGVKAGVPDMMLPVAIGQYHGLWIELKKIKGVATADQKEWLVYLWKQGYAVGICYGWEEARDLLIAYLTNNLWKTIWLEGRINK